MKVGQWVTVKNFSERTNGKEGLITNVTKRGGNTFYYVFVSLSQGRIIQLNQFQVTPIAPYINHNELIDLALKMNDKEWFNELVERYVK